MKVALCLYLLLNCSMIGGWKDARKGGGIWKIFTLMQLLHLENYELEKMRDGHVVVTENQGRRIIAQIIMEMRTEVSSLYPVWPSQWLVVISQGRWGPWQTWSIDVCLKGLGCLLRSIADMCPRWTDGLELDVDHYQSKTGHCPQATLPMFCYGSGDESAQQCTFKTIFLILWNLGRHRNRWVDSHFTGIPWLRDFTNPTGQVTQEKVFAYVILSWTRKFEEDLAE